MHGILTYPNVSAVGHSRDWRQRLHACAVRVWWPEHAWRQTLLDECRKDAGLLCNVDESTPQYLPVHHAAHACISMHATSIISKAIGGRSIIMNIDVL